MPWYIEGGGNYIINGDPTFGRHVIVPVEEAETIRQRFKNINVFATVFTYDNKDQSVANLYGPLYLDLDFNINNDADYQKIKRDLMQVVTALNAFYFIPYEMIRIYFSGHKGFHIMIDPEIFGIEPNKNLNEHYKAIAVDLKKLTLFKTVDTGIYDRVRLFRFPNSIHGDTGLYKVPVDYEFIRNSTYQDIVDYASQPRYIEYPEPVLVNKAAQKFNETIKQYKEDIKEHLRANNPFQGRKSDILPCIKEMLITPGIAHVNRNKMAVVMASGICQSGTDIEKAMDMVMTWNTTYNTPKLPNSEIRKTVESAYQRVKEGKSYGCRTIQELGMCTPEKCKINNKRHN
jgi:hypothetical protein